MAGSGEGVKSTKQVQKLTFRLRGYLGGLHGREPRQSGFKRGKQRENPRISRRVSAGSGRGFTLGQLPFISTVFAAVRRMFRPCRDGVMDRAAAKARHRGALIPSRGHPMAHGTEDIRIRSCVKIDVAEIEVIFAPDGRVAHANEAACGVTYGLGDCLIGQHITDLFGPRLCDGAEIGGIWAQALQGQFAQGCFQMHPGEEPARIVDGQFSALRGPGERDQGVRFQGVEAAANSLGPLGNVKERRRPRRAMGS